MIAIFFGNKLLSFTPDVCKMKIVVCKLRIVVLELN